MTGLSATRSESGNRAGWRAANQVSRAADVCCSHLREDRGPLVCLLVAADSVREHEIPVRRNDMRIRQSLAVALLVLAGCGSALAADPSGTWLTQGGNSRVKIADCGGALCGTIIWLKEPNDEGGKPKT